MHVESLKNLRRRVSCSFSCHAKDLFYIKHNGCFLFMLDKTWLLLKIIFCGTILLTWQYIMLVSTCELVKLVSTNLAFFYQLVVSINKQLFPLLPSMTTNFPSENFVSWLAHFLYLQGEHNFIEKSLKDSEQVQVHNQNIVQWIAKGLCWHKDKFVELLKTTV